MKLQKKKTSSIVQGKSRGEEAGEIQGNRLVSITSLSLLLSYVNSTLKATLKKNGLTVTVEFDLH